MRLLREAGNPALYVQVKHGGGGTTHAHWKGAIAYARRLGLDVSVTFNHPAVLKSAASIFNLPAMRETVQTMPVAPGPVLPAKIWVGNKLVATNGDGMISLTDLWRVSGSANKSRTNLWLANVTTQEFIDSVAEKFGGRKSCLEVRHGVGTFAHWQIALAYAKWLSPELHMQVNEVFMRYKNGDATLAEEVIEKGLRGRIAWGILFK